MVAITNSRVPAAVCLITGCSSSRLLINSGFVSSRTHEPFGASADSCLVFGLRRASGPPDIQRDTGRISAGRRARDARKQARTHALTQTDRSNASDLRLLQPMSQSQNRHGLFIENTLQQVCCGNGRLIKLLLIV